MPSQGTKISTRCVTGMLGLSLALASFPAMAQGPSDPLTQRLSVGVRGYAPPSDGTTAPAGPAGAPSEHPRDDYGDVLGADGGGEPSAEPAPNPDDEVRSSAAEAFFAGQRDYDLGRYDSAIEKFERAWELSNEPSMLFNLGQAYWKRYKIKQDLEDLRRARQMLENYDKAMRGEADYESREIEIYLTAIDAQIEAAEAAAAARDRGEPAGPSSEELRLQRRRKITRDMDIAGTVLIIAGSLSAAVMLGGLAGRAGTGFMLDKAGGGETGTSNQFTADEDAQLRDAYEATGKTAFAGIILTSALLPIGITLKATASVRAKEDGKAQKANEEREQRLQMGPQSSLIRVVF